ncbi:MAG: integrase arm-type DNA-binding domain-containing protein, partial [Nitrosomonas sp.]|nr:integrase arm-type DNA-binding domain-containing protein [Nitrosomonas sp.]MDP1951945.1 integrase arm-type DNA-binding domain-containing protein [Nitrosomonas sp.]
MRKASPAARPYKLTDGHGLYLLVTATSKYWRVNYRFMGKQKTLALGVYPETSLATARKKRDEARALLVKDIDPSHTKRATRLAKKVSCENTFEVIALEWHIKQSTTWAETTSANVKRCLEVDIFPWLGDRPIQGITAPELLTVLRKIESRGAHEKAQRTREYVGRVFRYAIQTGRAERDPSGDL